MCKWSQKFLQQAWAASRLGAVVPQIWLAELQAPEAARVCFAWQPRGRALWPSCRNRPGLVTASSDPHRLEDLAGLD